MSPVYRTHLNIAALLTVLLAALLQLWPLTPTGQVLALLVFAGLIGLPHGLTDFALLRRAGAGISGGRKTGFITGLLLYLAVMGGFYLLWQVVPLLALLAFLALAGLHFGKQDAVAYGLKGWRLHLFAGVRGVMVLALPYVFHPQTAQVFNTMVGGEVFPALEAGTGAAGLACVVFLVPVLALKNLRLFCEQFGEQLLLVVIYLTLPPLLSFTLYFCLWHTPRHYIAEWDVIARHVPFALNRSTALLAGGVISAVVVLGVVLGILAAFKDMASADWQTPAAGFFILVSCLTAAHVAFTEVLGRTENRH